MYSCGRGHCGSTAANAIFRHFRGTYRWSRRRSTPRAMVTVIHSNSYPRFGSGIIVPEFDLIRPTAPGGLHSQPGHPNFPEPGRRPVTTPTPGGEIMDGTRMLVRCRRFSTRCRNAQMLRRIAAGENDPGCLIVAPRWEMAACGRWLSREEGFPEDVLAGFARIAPGVHPVPRWGMRSAMVIACVSPILRRDYRGRSANRGSAGPVNCGPCNGCRNVTAITVAVLTSGRDRHRQEVFVW